MLHSSWPRIGTSPIERSSTVAPGKRPTAAIQLKSFPVLPPVIPPSRIVIVNDVVTTGATMLADVLAVFGAILGVATDGSAFVRTQSARNLTATQSPVHSRIRVHGH